MNERRRSRWRVAVTALFAVAAFGSVQRALHASASCSSYSVAAHAGTIAGQQLDQQAQTLCAANPSSSNCTSAIASATTTWDWVAWNNGMYLCCSGGGDPTTCNALAANPATNPHDPVTTAQPGPALPN